MNDLDNFLDIWLPATSGGTYRAFAWWAGGYGVRNVQVFHKVTPSQDADRLKIHDLVGRCHELFFYVSTFSQRSTKNENAESSSFLWLDLDKAYQEATTHDEFERLTLPSTVWVTSEGHHQGLWALDRALDPKDRTEVNRAIYEEWHPFGADPSYDASRRLRLPGTVNMKPGNNESLVRLQLTSDVVYPADAFRRSSGPDTTGMPKIGSPDMRLINQLPMELVQLWGESPPSGGRSDVLMKLLLELAKLDLSNEEIFQIAATSGSNKFKDRPEQLWREVQKARALVERPPPGFRVTTPELPVTRERPGAPGGLSGHPLEGWLSREDLPEDYEIHWTINPFLPRKSVLMVAGLPGTRKSWLVSNLAVSVMHGVPFMNHPCQERGPVGYIAPDDERERLSERINLIEQKLDVKAADSRFYWRQSGFSFLDPKWPAKLEPFLKEVRPKILIMDGLYLLGYNPQDFGAGLPPRLVPLKEFCSEYDCSFVLVHHANKQGTGDDPRLAGQGLTLLGAFFTAAWALDNAGIDLGGWQRVNWRIAGKAVPGRPQFKLKFGPDLHKYEYEITTGAWGKDEIENEEPVSRQTEF